MMRLLIFLTTLLLIMSGCRSIQYVPVESVKVDSIYLNKILKDSIIIRDSVYVRDAGDTIYQYRYKYIYKDKIIRDTSYIERTDTIKVPYPVEAKLSGWQKFKMDAGGFCLTAGLFIILIVVGKSIYKIRR